MNECQRKQIKTMRKQGIGYKVIAKKLKLSRDSIRNYCKRRHLNGYGTVLAAIFGKENTHEEK